MDEFNYGSNRTRTVLVICPWIRKFAIFDFVYTLASAEINQSIPNLATIYMPIGFWMSLIMGQIQPEHQKLFALEFWKFAESDFVYRGLNAKLFHLHFGKFYKCGKNFSFLWKELLDHSF